MNLNPFDSILAKLLIDLIDQSIKEPTLRVIIKTIMFATFAMFVVGLGNLLAKSLGLSVAFGVMVMLAVVLELAADKFSKS